MPSTLADDSSRLHLGLNLQSVGLRFSLVNTGAGVGVHPVSPMFELIGRSAEAGALLLAPNRPA